MIQELIFVGPYRRYFSDGTTVEEVGVFYSNLYLRYDAHYPGTPSLPFGIILEERTRTSVTLSAMLRKSVSSAEMKGMPRGVPAMVQEGIYAGGLERYLETLVRPAEVRAKKCLGRMFREQVEQVDPITSPQPVPADLFPAYQIVGEDEYQQDVRQIFKMLLVQNIGVTTAPTYDS